MRQPKVGEVIYAFAWPGNRVGETEFLCETQEHATKNLSQLLNDVEEEIGEQQENSDPPLSRHEALEDMGGEPIIYEMKRIK